MTIYDFHATSIDGSDIALSGYRGNVLLIVNVASQCKFSSQYEGFENLYQKYRGEGFLILGFPSNQFGNQEPGTESEILNFCQVRYGVTFPLFSKIDVNGANAHPLYSYLTKAKPGILGTRRIKWNFTKFLVDREGRVIRRYGPRTRPEGFSKEIAEAVLSCPE